MERRAANEDGDDDSGKDEDEDEEMEDLSQDQPRSNDREDDETAHLSRYNYSDGSSNNDMLFYNDDNDAIHEEDELEKEQSRTEEIRDIVKSVLPKRKKLGPGRNQEPISSSEDEHGKRFDVSIMRVTDLLHRLAQRLKTRTKESLASSRSKGSRQHWRWYGIKRMP